MAAAGPSSWPSRAIARAGLSSLRGSASHGSVGPPAPRVSTGPHSVGLRGSRGGSCPKRPGRELSLLARTRQDVRPPLEIVECDRKRNLGGATNGLAVLAKSVGDKRNEHAVAQ